jgi:hypothetical protein
MPERACTGFLVFESTEAADGVPGTHGAGGKRGDLIGGLVAKKPRKPSPKPLALPGEEFEFFAKNLPQCLAL